MPFDSIGGLSAISSALPMPAVTPTLPTAAAAPGAQAADAVAGTDAVDGAGFGAALANEVDGLQALQGTRDTLTLQAATGDLQDIHQATIAAAEASATMDLMVAMRNSGLQAFNELMRIQA